MKKFLFTLSLLVVVFTTLSSQCDRTPEKLIPPTETEIFFYPQNNIRVSANGGVGEFSMAAGGAWTAYVMVDDPMLDQFPDWFELTLAEGDISLVPVDQLFTVQENPSIEYRTINVNFVLNAYPDIVHVLTITQDGQGVDHENLTAYITPEKKVSNTYPLVSGEKVTVETERHGLWFFGWGQGNDKKFTVDFPESTDEFNRVIMTYRMGAGPSGCSGYDHLTTFAFMYEGEWWEIARAVTPFGNSFISPNFQKLYYFDVTEYLPMLQGATEFKLYFNGFDASPEGKHHTAQLIFDFYKGERELNQIFAKKLYDSDLRNTSGYRSFEYGRELDSIELPENVGLREITIPEGVNRLQLKVVISGHGHDQGKFLDRPEYRTRNAAEFDENFYTLKLNGEALKQRGRIFIPCDQNYTQAGTAYFDRANWCPGNPVRIEMWEIVNLPEGGGTFTLDIDFERFESESQDGRSDGSAKYGVAVDIFGYEAV